MGKGNPGLQSRRCSWPILTSHEHEDLAADPKLCHPIFFLLVVCTGGLCLTTMGRCLKKWASGVDNLARASCCPTIMRGTISGLMENHH